jgi:hypothetical protein
MRRGIAAFSCISIFLAVCLRGYTQQPSVRQYAFSLQQHIAENTSSFRGGDSPAHFNTARYSSTGTLFLMFSDDERLAITCIYTNNDAVGIQLPDTIRAILHLTNGINTFYTCHSTSTRQLFVLKKILSFIQVFKESSVRKKGRSAIENCYDGLYLASYSLKEKYKQSATYIRQIQKAHNENLRSTRTIMDRYDALLTYKQHHLYKVSVNEKKRQKFGNLLLSEVETIFSLHELPSGAKENDASLCTAGNTLIEQTIFTTLSKAERKKLNVAGCILNRSFGEIMKGLIDQPDDLSTIDRKYICQVAALYHFFPDSIYQLEKLFNTTVSDKLRRLITRGAVESISASAHDFIAAVLDESTGNEYKTELLVQVSSLGYTESTNLVNAILKLTNNKEYSNTAKLCMANIAYGIKDTYPNLSYSIKDTLYCLFISSNNSLSDSLQYLNQIANAGDTKRLCFIEELLLRNQAPVLCINALQHMPDSTVFSTMKNLDADNYSRYASEILSLLTSFYPSIPIRKSLFKLYRYCNDNEIKQVITGFLLSFKDEIPMLENELKNL